MWKIETIDRVCNYRIGPIPNYAKMLKRLTLLLIKTNGNFPDLLHSTYSLEY